MLNAKGLAIVLPFAVAILALICVGVKEYRRIEYEQKERRGLDPSGQDRKAGLSSAELNQISAEVFRADRTRRQMKQLAAKSRGGYQRRYKVEG